MYEDDKTAANKKLALGLNSPLSVKTAKLHFKTGLTEIVYSRNLRIRVEKLADQIEKLRAEQRSDRNENKEAGDKKELIETQILVNQTSSDNLKPPEVPENQGN